MICPSCNGTGEMPDLKIDPGVSGPAFVNVSNCFACECGASYLFPEDAERCCELCSVCGAVKCHSVEMNIAWRDWKDGQRLGLCPHPEEPGHGETCTCCGNGFRVKGSGRPRAPLAP